MNRWKGDAMTALQDPNGACDLLILSNSVSHSTVSIVNGSAIDLRQYFGVATVIFQVGVLSAGTLVPALQDSPDGTSDWLPFTSVAFDAVTGGASNQRRAFLVSSTRGFIRFSADNQSGSFRYSACILAPRCLV
jgi:hypothetical protein